MSKIKTAPNEAPSDSADKLRESRVFHVIGKLKEILFKLTSGHNTEQNNTERPIDIYDHISPDRITGLGQRAVETNINLANSLLMNNSNLADFYKEYLMDYVQRTRDRLDMLNEWQREELNKLISENQPGEWLSSILDIDPKNSNVADYVHALTEKKPDGETYAVGDQQIINFLEWHNYLLAQKQKKFNERAPELKNAYRSS